MLAIIGVLIGEVSGLEAALLLEAELCPSDGSFFRGRLPVSDEVLLTLLFSVVDEIFLFDFLDLVSVELVLIDFAIFLLLLLLGSFARCCRRRCCRHHRCAPNSLKKTSPSSSFLDSRLSNWLLFFDELF